MGRGKTECLNPYSKYIDLRDIAQKGTNVHHYYCRGGFMETNNEYEKMFLKEIRGIPDNAHPQVLKILRSFKESILAIDTSKKAKVAESGLCGIWKDDRNAESGVRKRRQDYR